MAFVQCRVKQASSAGKSGLTPKQETQAKELIIKGTTEKVLGNYEIAEKYFHQCIKIAPKVAVAYFELSEIYQYQRDATNAIKYGELAAKIEPGNEWYIYNMAQLYSRTGQLDLAEKTFYSLIKEQPKNYTYLYDLSEILLYRRKYKEVLDIYIKLEESIGINEELSLHKANIYLDLKQPSNAIKELEKLIATNPNEMRYVGMLADLYEELGESEKAFEFYQKILTQEPENGYVHLSLCDYYNFRSQQDKAFEELAKAFKNKNVDIKIKSQRIESYYVNSSNNESKRKEAYKLLAILIETHADEPSPFLFYAQFLTRDQLQAEAAVMLKKAVANNSNDFSTFYQLCSVLWDTQQFEDLGTYSMMAIELFPVLPTFYYFAGVGAYQLKKYPESIELFQQCIDFSIDNETLKMDCFQFLGDAFHFTHQYEESNRAYEKALKFDPNNTYVLNNYAYFLAVRKEQLDKAKNMAEKCVQLEANNATYIDTYGYVLFRLEQYEKAQLQFSKAVEIDGNNPDYLEHLGDVLYHLNQVDRAISCWKDAKSKGSTSTMLDKKIQLKKYVE
jgi:tetratricopeptide (TPR) repeat protein